MSQKEITEQPKPSKGDIALTAARMAISSLPVLGGPATELFSALITPPLSKRRDEWVSSIAEGLKELEDQVENFDISKLSQNDQFITVTMQAGQIAIRNHRHEKIEALRAAILNTATKISVDDDIQIMFLNFIDTLTESHIHILKFFQSPLEWLKRNNIKYDNISTGSLAQILELAFEEMRGKGDMYDQMVKDLYSHGLIGIESLHTMMTAQGLFAPRTTQLGNQFIKYITSPLRKS